MAKHTLSATSRQVHGRKVNQLRRQGLVPASVFGKKVPSVDLQLNAKEFSKLYKLVGESTLVYLKIEGEKEPRPVLVSEIAYHPVSGQLLHVGFHQVDLKEKVVAPVAIELVGESPAEKDKQGILVQQLDEIEIEALPTDMPEHIDVDVSILALVDQAILVKDLKLDSKLLVKSDPESIIAKIEPLAAEEKVEVAVPAEVSPETGSTEGVAPSEEAKSEVKPEASSK